MIRIPATLFSFMAGYLLKKPEIKKPLQGKNAKSLKVMNSSAYRIGMWRQK